jgi:uncharacterized protein (TIGR02145 family)
MYTVEAGKQVKIWVSVKINISFSRPFPKNQITYQLSQEVDMRLLWIWLIFLVCFKPPYAQTVNLTGIVTNSANNLPLSSVIVSFAKLGYSDTTGSDGKYSLMSPPVSVIVNKSIGLTEAHPIINGGFLFFNLPQKEKVTAAIYSPAGRAIRTILDKELAPGTYRAALPSIQKSEGIYYIKVISGNSQEIVKFLLVNEKQGQNRSVNQYSRLNKKLAIVVDTLIFKKTDYVTKNVPITSYESAMNVTMTLAAPLAPVISGITVGDSSSTVGWGTVAGATSYNLYYNAGTSLNMTSGTKLTGVTSPKQVTGLINGTQYTFAISAVNAGGESGLSSIVTTTPNVVDIDGNIYHTVTIGTQAWMVENLKTTKYNDSSAIPLDTNSSTWGGLTTGAYCWYNNDSTTYKNPYGALYNWYAVSTGKLAPTGWHVPTDSEWTVLTTFLGGTSVAVRALEDTGTTYWLPPKAGATNSSGFSALPGGGRFPGIFGYIGYYGWWWSSTAYNASNSWVLTIPNNGSVGYFSNNNGYSVRCLRGVISPSISGIAIGNSSAMVSWGTVAGAISYNLYYKAGTTVDMTNGTKLTRVTSPKQVTGLINGTQYAFALSAVYAGEESRLGNIVTATPNVVDIDGNAYHTVTIGTQVWMVENLKTTRYNDGSAIPMDTNKSIWSGLTTGAYCWYNNSATYGSTYGALYNWYAVNTGKLAPIGWHVPTDSEWTILTTFLGGTSVAGGALKSTGTIYWLAPNTGATNSSGFSALPGGCCSPNGTFTDISYTSYWWSSTMYNVTLSWLRYLENEGANAVSVYNSNNNGYSVRCLRD